MPVPIGACTACLPSLPSRFPCPPARRLHRLPASQFTSQPRPDQPVSPDFGRPSPFPPSCSFAPHLFRTRLPTHTFADFTPNIVDDIDRPDPTPPCAPRSINHPLSLGTPFVNPASGCRCPSRVAALLAQALPASWGSPPPHVVVRIVDGIRLSSSHFGPLPTTRSTQQQHAVI
jgi:hypothetical protein